MNWISVQDKPIPVINEGGKKVLIYFDDNSISAHKWPASVAEPWRGRALYWMELPDIPKPKRWTPKEGEKFYYMNITGSYESDYWKEDFLKYEAAKNFLGVYKTKDDCIEMMSKIIDLVAKEIGEP